MVSEGQRQEFEPQPLHPQSNQAVKETGSGWDLGQVLFFFWPPRSPEESFHLSAESFVSLPL